MPTRRVVLVTGASSGIGRAIASHLARRGWCVFGTSRSPDKTGINGVTMLPLDVRDAESVRACVRAVIEQAGRIDALVNNAGQIGPAGAFEEVSLDQLRALFETNFFGVVQMTNAVLPHMREQLEGRIVNVSSAAGLVAGPPFFGAYAASKHALEGYSEALRLEVRPFGIHVSLVEPGYFRSSIDQSIQPPANPLDDYEFARQRVQEMDLFSLRQGRDPVIVARAAARILESESPRLRYVVGTDSLGIVLAKRLLPYSLVENFQRWVYLEGDPARLGLRRAFIDSQLRDGLLFSTAATLFALAARRLRRK